MTALEAWLVPWAPYGCPGGVAGPLPPSGCRGGVVGPLGSVWLPWRHGWSPGSSMDAVGAWPVPWALYGPVEAWPIPWAPYGRPGCVAGTLGLVWPPWRHGQSPGPHMAAMGAWPVSWAPYGCRGGVAGPLGPVWTPRRRNRYPGSRMATVGEWQVPWFRTFNGDARPVPWAPYGCHLGMAGFLNPVWPPWGRGWSPRPREAAVGAWPVHRAPMAAVGAWPVPSALYGCRGEWPVSWAPYDRRGGVAGPLHPFTCRGAWSYPWAPYGCCGGLV